MTQSRILVVEDEAVIAANLTCTLSSQGYLAIGPVATGEDAIREARESHPDLVLMDIELIGGMNGIAAAAAIHTTSPVPIIYLTAYTDDTRLKQALKTDPYGYLVKPVHCRELCTMIETVLNKSRTEQRIRENEERYRAVVTGAQEGIILIDANSKEILEVNPAFKERFGYTDEEVASLTLYDIMAEEPAEVDRDLLKVVKKGHLPGEKRFRCKDTSEIMVGVHAGVIDQYRDDAVVFIITYDLSCKNQVEEALLEANKKLRILTGLTRHDILNQLSAMHGLVYLSMNESDPECVQKYLSTAHKVCGEIGATVGFTREYETLGGASFGWYLVSPIIESAKTGVVSESVTIENEIPVDLEVYTDQLIRKVFSTLIDNAIRHGEDVTTICFSCFERDGDLVITCEDDGAGIPEEEKALIFDQGYGKNTGIGLFLAGEILGVTGMSIKETGTPGKGARFEVIVPAGKFRRTA